MDVTSRHRRGGVQTIPFVSTLLIDTSIVCPSGRTQSLAGKAKKDGITALVRMRDTLLAV
jgi:hypothetical protein